MRKAGLLRIVTLIIGIIFLILGISGLLSNEVFGWFTTNSFQACIQILIAVAAFVSFAGKNYRPFLKFLGIILMLVGLIWFLGIGGDWLVRIFNINRPLAIFNLVIGLIVLVLALTLKSTQANHRSTIDIVF